MGKEERELHVVEECFFRNNLPFVEVRHNNHKFLALIDTGAKSSIIAKSVRMKFCASEAEKTSQSFYTIDGNQMSSTESICIEFEIGNSSLQSQFAILPMEKYEMILGQNTIRKYNLMVDNEKQMVMQLNTIEMNTKSKKVNNND
ncbi:hypothetical protein SNEBB_001210 [Seison nebaliae]|nr:hypothetical protein SNEBB_001210 [Seison nebaliae]